MKITNEQLKQIIKEELDNIMAEMADYSQMDSDQLYGELEDLYFLIVKDNAKSREEKTAAVREFEKVGKELLKVTKGDAHSSVYSMWEEISKLGLGIGDWATIQP